MKTKKIFVAMLALLAHCAYGQTLEKMNWFNEPENWNIDGDKRTMSGTPNSDYGRISH